MRELVWGGLVIIFASSFALAQVQVRSVEIGGRFLHYQVVDGDAVTDGDILLGRAEDLESPRNSRARQSAIQLFGSTSPVRWTNGTIYYVIDPGLPNPSQAMAAIQMWNSNTPLKVLPRDGQPNYVRFQRSTTLCTSAVGMVGGEQLINVTDDCGIPGIAHEIGHAFGLLHEHQRNDRNAFVTILSENIDPRLLFAFEQRPATIVDSGFYDYDSVMHYSPTAFRRGFADTIETVPIGITIGQRVGLSPGDIDAVSRLYGIIPTNTTITTIPQGLTVMVDGASVVTPQSFPWAPGSTHTVSVPAEFGADPKYKLVRWSDGGAPSHTITASADVTLYAAIFQRLFPTSVAVTIGTGTATLAPRAGDGYYPDRLPVRVTAAPAAQFFNWSSTPNLATYGYGLATPDAVVQIAGPNGQFSARFTTSRTVTILSEPIGRRVTVDGTTYTTPIKFTFTAGTPHTIAAVVDQQDNSNETKYQFLSWSDGGEASHTITAPTNENATYTARFSTRYMLNTMTTGSGTVTVSPPSADGFYNAGTEVQVSAAANPGNEHRYWSGDLAGGGSPRSVLMNGPKHITGRFGSPLPFTLYNGASFSLHPLTASAVAAVAPLELVTIYSALTIGPGSLMVYEIDGNGRFSTSLGGTRILFDGVPAPLIYVSPNQVSAIVPNAVSGRANTTVQIERNGQIVATQTFAVIPAFPSMFTSDSSGKGQIAALNQDGSINTKNNPLEAGKVIVIYATGGGDMLSLIPDGQIADLNLIGVAAPVQVRVGKHPAQVIYAGSAPGIVNGAIQINAILPPELLPDLNTPIQLIVGNYASPPGTTIAVK